MSKKWNLRPKAAQQPAADKNEEAPTDSTTSKKRRGRPRKTDVTKKPRTLADPPEPMDLSSSIDSIGMDQYAELIALSKHFLQQSGDADTMAHRLLYKMTTCFDRFLQNHPHPADIERAHSIVISGMPESSKQDAVSRRHDDNALFDAVLNELDIEAGAVKLYRMGKKAETDRPRLVKVVVETVGQQRILISQSRRLQHSTNSSLASMRIRPSLTQKEREDLRK
uniref:Uncharacterized protein n=1 Tax=Panagrellus redivivus TaxID=6233 RepID=A0A7E4W063_PANRE